MTVTIMENKNYEYYPLANTFAMMCEWERLDDPKPLRFLMCAGVPS